MGSDHMARTPGWNGLNSSLPVAYYDAYLEEPCPTASRASTSGERSKQCANITTDSSYNCIAAYALDAYEGIPNKEFLRIMELGIAHSGTWAQTSRSQTLTCKLSRQPVNSI